MTATHQQHDQELPLFAAMGERSPEKVAPVCPRPLDTRALARQRIAGKAGQIRGRVLSFIAQCGEAGTTDHEISERLGLLGDTARARRCELRDSGLVRDSGRERLSPSGRKATVWVVTNGANTADAGGIDLGVDEDPREPIGLNQAGLMLQREQASCCPWCGGREFWQSVYGVVTCQECHAPASSALVVRRFTRGNEGAEGE